MWLLSSVENSWNFVKMVDEIRSVSFGKNSTVEEGRVAYDLLGDCVPCVTLGKFVPLGRLHDWTERYGNRTAFSKPLLPSSSSSLPRLASDNRLLIAFVIPIINNASIVTEEGWRWVAGELNALTRIIGLRWMVNGKYTGTAVIEYKTRLLRSIITGLNCTACFDTNV